MEQWHNHYLPIGAYTILDIGSGCGETCFFYLAHGAQHVVCVEGDPVALEHLYKNYAGNPKVTIVPVRISNIKIDIDGAERNMLFETHYPVKFEQVWRDGDSETRLWKVVE